MLCLQTSFELSACPLNIFTSFFNVFVKVTPPKPPKDFLAKIQCLSNDIKWPTSLLTLWLAVGLWQQYPQMKSWLLAGDQWRMIRLDRSLGDWLTLPEMVFLQFEQYIIYILTNTEILNFGKRRKKKTSKKFILSFILHYSRVLKGPIPKPTRPRCLPHDCRSRELTLSSPLFKVT